MKRFCFCNRRAVIVQGHQSLCPKHYRFQQMRSKAKVTAKKVPTKAELESLIPKDFKCPVCKRDMNWLQRNGADTVITLQHDRNGKVRLLCLSCNVRHASFGGDSFYSHDQTKRVCPSCRNLLPFSEFCTDRTARWKSKGTYCRKCRTVKHNNWIAKNRKRENEKRRDYYYRRKASGNPIPR